MEENSTQALFCEPNAYIQHCDRPIKKVVFQQPYDCLPNFYINNDFVKHNCDCMPKQKQSTKGLPFNLDLKSLTPLLSVFGGGDVAKMVSLLSSVSSGGGLGDLLKNKDVLSLIKNFNLNKSKNKTTFKPTTTEFEIKNYTRVD